MSESNREEILSSYYTNDNTDYAKLTPWLEWKRNQKKSIKPNNENKNLVLLDYEKLAEYSWKIDVENIDRIKPSRVVEGVVQENPMFNRLENLIDTELKKYQTLNKFSTILYEKNYRYSYGNIDKSISIIHANGSTLFTITKNMYSDLENIIKKLPISTKPIRTVPIRTVLPDENINYEESEKNELRNIEELEQSLKTYNKYTMYKLQKNKTDVEYTINDGTNEIVYTDGTTESIVFDYETLDGSMISRRGNTFYPIYTPPLETIRELPADENVIKIVKNGVVSYKTVSDFKTKNIVKRTSTVKNKKIV